MKKNPIHYNLSPSITEDELENHLKEVCIKNLNLLADAQLIDFKNEIVTSTEIGKSMARFYVAFDTMRSFKNISKEATLGEMVSYLSQAKEFEEFRFRQGDKKHLNAINLNKEKMRFPIRGKIKTIDEKVNCLIQAAFGDIPCEDWSLKQQQNTILLNAPRIMRCMVEYLSVKSRFLSLQNAIILYSISSF
jgi:ATP-dependent DNA helicase HFM1/MER3